jgi:RimJ/RimL family protein N-acetyltransferase
MEAESRMAPPSLPLKTASLVLRPFTLGDAPRMFVLSQEDASRTWLPSQVYPDEVSAVSALTFLLDQFATPGDPRRGPYVLGIEHRTCGTLIGHVGFSPYEGDVEIGFAVAREYQRRGLAVEAIVAACSWVFQEFELARILGVVSVANIGSCRTLARAGFVHQEDKVVNAQGTVQPVSVYARLP